MNANKDWFYGTQNLSNMVITRLSGRLTYKRNYAGVFSTSHRYPTRRSYATIQSSDGGSQTDQKPTQSSGLPASSKKSTKTKIKFSDLPDIYVPPSGVPGAPLKSWFSGSEPGKWPSMRLLLLFEISNIWIVDEKVLIDIAAKPTRKRRSTKSQPRNYTFSQLCYSSLTSAHSPWHR